jgi:hypothetical protein
MMNVPGLYINTLFFLTASFAWLLVNADSIGLSKG